MCALVRQCLSGGTKLRQLGNIPGCFINLPEYDYAPATGK